MRITIGASLLVASLVGARPLRTQETRTKVKVADLSGIFGISEVTVRGDLASLSDKGLLQRVHGGAIVAHPPLHLIKAVKDEEQPAGLVEPGKGLVACSQSYPIPVGDGIGD